jgi:hypothetical protein
MLIYKKLTLTFLILATVPMLVLGFFSFINARSTLTLETIADLKVDKIESFFAERRGNLIIALEYESVKLYLPVLSALANDQSNPEYQEAVKKVVV